MSITLKVASATNLVLTKARTLVNGLVFQNLGTTYAGSTKYSMTQNVNGRSVAKTRFNLARPFTNAAGDVKYNYITIEVQVQPDSPITAAGELPWLAQTMASDASFTDAVVSNAFTAS